MNHVLITGATGAIGSSIIPYFLDDPDTSVHVVVRSRDGTHLRERMSRVERFCQIPDSSLSRLHAYRGNVEERDLGLSSSDYEDLRKKICQVIHVAGNVRLNQAPQEARIHACGALENILAFCDRASQFRKLDVASTVGVAGRQSGLVTETRVQRSGAFRNSYEASKAEAESLLYTAVDSGVPATIHRPSMVIGNSINGRIIHFQVFYYLCEFLTGRLTAGFVPDAGNTKLDIIPVDYVGRGIYLASNDTSTAGKILHLCSGPTHSIELERLSKFVRDYWISKCRRLPRLKRLKPGTFRRLVDVASPVSPRRLRRSLRTLPFFLDYLDQDQSFDNTRTQTYLSSRGLLLPRIEDYLDHVLDYYRTRQNTAESPSVRSKRHAAVLT